MNILLKLDLLLCYLSKKLAKDQYMSLVFELEVYLPRFRPLDIFGESKCKWNNVKHSLTITTASNPFVLKHTEQ